MRYVQGLQVDKSTHPKAVYHLSGWLRAHNAFANEDDGDDIQKDRKSGSAAAFVLGRLS
ncbi:hypothetical protein MCOR07_003842 [Pyricularia oryzae]|nr:hypothetical protein MCOR07_003842 [Pyricularia oryzae]